MKKSVLILTASVLLLVSTQTAMAADVVVISGKKADVADQSYKMHMEDFLFYKGAYDLSNGKSIAVYNQGLRMFAQLDGQDRQEIFATSRDTFASANQQMKMRIELLANGNVRGEVQYRDTNPGTASAGNGEQLVLATFR